MKKMANEIDWVSVNTDMPCDDPKNPGYSIPVRIKVINNKGKAIILNSQTTVYYVYCEEKDCWFNADNGNRVPYKVIGWTNEDYYGKTSKRGE
jgi:hypothetical protein